MAPSAVDVVQETSSKPNIYLLEVFPPAAVKYCQERFRTILPDDPEVVNWRTNAESILVREKTITAEDIAAAPKLRAIGKQGTGIDILDQDACDKRGIAICNTPGVNAQSVAELVMALTLGVKRQLHSISVKQAAGLEVRKEHCSGTMMTGKAVGILGMGAIGTAVARMFRGAFGCPVWAYDPFAPADAWSDIPHTRVDSFEEMLPHVDMLTLHIPLTPKTRGLLGAAQMAKMRSSAVLINVARGGIVDEEALMQALEEGRLAGAGLDCHEEEPPALGRYERLWATGKVISTPHFGATTVETQVRTATAAMDTQASMLRKAGFISNMSWLVPRRASSPERDDATIQSAHTASLHDAARLRTNHTAPLPAQSGARHETRQPASALPRRSRDPYISHPPNVQHAQVLGPPRRSDARILDTAFYFCLTLLVVLFLGGTAKMPAGSDVSRSGLEALALPFGGRLTEALIAVIAVGLVTLVYTLLIQRGALIATTCLYPRRPIEANIGSILDATWPLSSEDAGASSKANESATRRQGRSCLAIQLFYIGKMRDDPRDGLAAKGRQQSNAEPAGEENRRPVWLTSGSPLTRNVVQTMVWEWVSLWLMMLMTVSLLLFNGFFTDDLVRDSYPRLTITMIYAAAYMAHFFYVWIASLDFFTLVFAGASWSLLERSKFVVAETHRLQSHPVGAPFQFRSIDKSNEAFVPTTFTARLGSPATQATPSSTLPEGRAAGDPGAVPAEGTAELRTALETINASQKTEREYATDASKLALDRVMANAMLMMAVTLSSSFASWTSSQFTSDTPNNTATTQIGSLALLASLSLGAAAMFSSAMQLNIMKSSFRTIVSLKETKINGMALDLHRKTRIRAASSPPTSRLTPVAFTEADSLPLADARISDFFTANRSLGLSGLLGTVLLGPGYAMLPRLNDYHRKSDEFDFDFIAPLEGGRVILTTRETDRHARHQGSGNLDPIIACYVQDERFGKESC